MRPIRHAQELVKKQFQPSQPVRAAKGNSVVTVARQPGGVETTIPNWIVHTQPSKVYGRNQSELQIWISQVADGKKSSFHCRLRGSPGHVFRGHLSRRRDADPRQLSEHSNSTKR